MSDGMPWWTLLDGARQVRAQDAWLCQVCGHPLGKAALVVLQQNQTKVLSDTGLHHHCLDLSAVVCPHLSTTRTAYTVAEVIRGDLRADGRPLPPVRPHAVEDDGHLWTPAWTLPDLAAARTWPLGQYRPPAVTLRPPGTPVTDTTTPTAYAPDPAS
ncbi:hypothetical protein [Amycolatopsis magusensis]|uniref:hypothetical protein n=1 Tax=Amycolatopsis magusensis TaxID=882444 RepID=UPI0037B20285